MNINTQRTCKRKKWRKKNSTWCSYIWFPVLDDILNRIHTRKHIQQWLRWRLSTSNLQVHLIISKGHRHSTPHESSPPYYHLSNEKNECNIHFELIIGIKLKWKQLLTCSLKVICSFRDFFVKLVKNDNVNTKAALPNKTRHRSMELTATEVPGLQRTQFREHEKKMYTVFFSCTAENV